LQRGYVAWLSARPETIDHRLRQDPTTASRRPNLLRRGGIDEIRAMASARAPWYRQLAHLALETDDGSPDEIAESIVAAFKRQIQDQAKANVQAN
jgi:shikimate kinase